MSRHRRMQKQRRQARGRSRPHLGRVRTVAEAIAILRDLDRATKTPTPRTFPGAVDSEVARPDLCKAHYGEWVHSRTPFRFQLRELERRYQQGPLFWVPSIEHWAMEEYFWHGLPGSECSPFRSWLDSLEGEFSSALVSLPDGYHLLTVQRLVPMTPAEIEQVGIYFEIVEGDEVTICGATGLRAYDPYSPNFRILEEYHAYRDEVGPPPGMANAPHFMQIK